MVHAHDERMINAQDCEAFGKQCRESARFGNSSLLLHGDRNDMAYRPHTRSSQGQTLNVNVVGLDRCMTLIIILRPHANAFKLGPLFRQHACMRQGCGLKTSAASLAHDLEIAPHEHRRGWARRARAGSRRSRSGSARTCSARSPARTLFARGRIESTLLYVVPVIWDLIIQHFLKVSAPSRILPP
jgi:hypothetical protein